MMASKFLFSSVIALAAMTFSAPAQAEMRCGMAFQAKSDVTKTPEGFDTAVFIYFTTETFSRKFKGFALILTDENGNRLGFHRQGWAVDPCESGQTGAIFDLNTETAIGSVTKLFSGVAMANAAPTKENLDMSILRYFPERWTYAAHPFYDTISVSDLLRYQGGFNKSGGGKDIWVRLNRGMERSSTARHYSNSIGIVHYIYAKFAKPGALASKENEFRSASLSVYNEALHAEAARQFNEGMYKTILKPLRISATCAPDVAQFPAGQSDYQQFYTLARSYKSVADPQGRLFPDETDSCASGGLYMSAKDLAKFMSVFSGPADSSVLPAWRRDLFINAGPAEDLMIFNAAKDKNNRRHFHKNGERGRVSTGGVSVADVIRFSNGYHVVFVANSPKDGVKVKSALIDAFELAYKPVFRRNPEIGPSRADDTLQSTPRRRD